MSARWLTGIPYLSFVATFLCFAFLGTALAQDAGPARGEDGAGDVFKPPRIILGTQQQPVYPPAAFDARYTGSVLVEMKVLKDGSVGEVKIVECTRPKVGFEEAAAEAVKKWRFEPGVENGEPVDVWTRLKLNFTRIGSGDKARPQVSAGSFTTDTDIDAGSSSASSPAPAAGGVKR